MKTSYHKKLFPLALLLAITVAACASRLASDRQLNGAQAAPSTDSSDQSTEPKLVIQSGHVNAVNGIAFSRDSKLIATAGGERTIKLWDTATGTQLGSLEGHQDAVFAVAFSPDGKTIASGSYDGSVKLWDVARGNETRSMDAHASGVYAVAFSPDGKVIASAGAEDPRSDEPHAIKFWDTASGQLLGSVDRETEVRTVSFGPDGKAIVSDSYGSSSLLIWDVETGKKTRELKGTLPEVDAVALSPDGKLIAGGSGAQRIELYDAVTGTLLRTLEAPMHEVKGGQCEGEYGTETSLVIAFSPDSRSLLSGACDHTTTLWDAVTGRQKFSLQGHSGAVVSVAFSPDGKTIASGSLDQTVMLWDSGSGKELRSLASHISEVHTVALSPDGKIIARGSADGKVKLWDSATRKPLLSLEGHVYRINGLAFTPNGRVLASGGADNKIILWNVLTGRLLRKMEAGPIHGASESAPRLTSIAFSPDGRLIASAGNHYSITIWNAATGREIRSLQANLNGGTSAVEKVAFSPDGKVIAAIYENSNLVLWNVTSGKQSLSVETSGVTALAFSTNGKEIVTGNGDGTIKLWDAATGKEVRSSAGHSDWEGPLNSGPDVFSLAFSPEGKTFVSASRDGTLKLWDTASGNLLRSFTGHRSEVRSVTFSTNGKVIVSGSLDGTMMLWSPNSDEPLATLVTLDQADWVVVTPDNHFDASPGAEKLMHFVVTSPEGQYKILPLAELRSRQYEAGLLQRLLKGGV